MYQFIENSDRSISLHDCRATAVGLNGNVLSFTFADGICIGKRHPRNTYGKTMMTGQAQVDFILPQDDHPESNFTCYVFFKKKNKTVRKVFSIEKLARKMREKGHTLEFLYAYKGHDSIIYECVMWRKKKPYSRECQLVITPAGTSYSWNELRPDKTV